MAIIGIIGTAGRDKTKPMTLALWKWMLQDAYSRVPAGSHVGSGGAAWADHLVVSMFLFGYTGNITLHLPAPFVDGKYQGEGFKSAGSTANYYHEMFGKVIGRNTLEQIGDVIAMRASMPERVHITEEPASASIGGMFARNAKVAQFDELLAYTFGEGDVPADGGTKDTWDKCQGKKTHISLPLLY
jgi:hypothetical protein